MQNNMKTSEVRDCHTEFRETIRHAREAMKIISSDDSNTETPTLNIVEMNGGLRNLQN